MSANSQAEPASPAPNRRRSRRWPKVLLVLALVVAASLWGGYEWATAKAESILNSRLAERSLYLSYTGRSWVPWRGLGLVNMALFQDAARTRPILKLSQLDVDFPWKEIARSGEFLSRWKLENATLELNDDKGKVVLQNLTVNAVVRPGQIEYTRLDLRNGARTFALSGTLHLRQENEAKAAPKDFVLDLDPLRSILRTLDFKQGAGEFLISGTISLDARETPMAWSADLTGEGRKVVWQGLPMEKLVMKTRMSDAGLSGTSSFIFEKGRTDLDLKLKDWEGAPLEFSGKIKDASGREDVCTGEYIGREKMVKLHSLEGRADLLEFLGNFPGVRPHLPQGVRVRTHPDVVVKDLVWQIEPSSWSMASLQLRTPLEMTVKAGEHDLALNQVRGHVAFLQGTWKLTDVSAKLLGGSLALDGNMDGTVLRNASITMNDLQMAQLSPWFGEKESSFGKASVTLNYKGAFAVEPENLTGSGSLRIDQAPTVQVPLLDQTYALFSALIPGIKRETGTGEMQGRFTSNRGVLTFSSFEATGGSVIVTGSGNVDLVDRHVSARARGKLRGVEGIITSPLSHLLEMEVTGPLDDIRVRPVGGNVAVGAVKGTVGVATDTVKEAGKAAGTVVKEGVKLPFRALGLFKKGKK